MLLDSQVPPEVAACQLAFELSSIAAGILTLEGRPLWFSSAFPALLGFTLEEFSGQSAIERIHPEDIPAFRERLAEFARGTPSFADVDRRYRHKEGHYIWLCISSNMIRDASGKPTHILGIFQDISERKSHERELGESRDFFNSILESVQDVVWSFSVPEDRLRFINSSATKTIYGRQAEEFYNDRELWINIVHPEDRSIVREIWQRLPSGFTEEVYRILRTDGEVRWVNSRTWSTNDTSGNPLRFQGVIRDITESRRNEQTLRESEARLLLINTAGKFGIWEIDLSSDEHYWTAGFRELLGVPANHPASAENFQSLIHSEDLARAQREFGDLIRGQRKYLQAIRMIRPDGTFSWRQGFAKIVRRGPEDAGKMIGVLMDVTEAKEAEQLIEAQQERLSAAAKMSALGEMAGGLAHEIINPLAIIHGHATLLRQQAACLNIDPGVLKDSADTIEHTSERISKIVKSLRTFARDVDNDPFQIVSAKAVIEETAALCTTRLSSDGVELLIDPIDESLKIECRPVQISQVLLNLLNNAFDAVEHLTKPWIRISTYSNAQFVRIEVIDSGSGIAPGLREKIFQPFFTTKDIGKGTGLGLSVSSGIVEIHSGTLVLDSSGPHTKFVLSLPKRKS